MVTTIKGNPIRSMLLNATFHSTFFSAAYGFVFRRRTNQQLCGVFFHEFWFMLFLNFTCFIFCLFKVLILDFIQQIELLARLVVWLFFAQVLVCAWQCKKSFASILNGKPPGCWTHRSVTWKNIQQFDINNQANEVSHKKHQTPFSVSSLESQILHENVIRNCIAIVLFFFRMANSVCFLFVGHKNYGLVFIWSHW